MSDLVSRVLAAIEAKERKAQAADGSPWAASMGGHPNAVFIAHNDPASVLRRCAADKRQVQRLAEMVELGEEYYDNPTVWDLVQDSLKDFADSYGISVEEETTDE